MRRVMFLCLLLILLSTVWACRKTDEDRLVEYLKQAYPPEYAEHVKLGVLDSVYDPYDSLCALLNIIDIVKDMPIMDAILHDNRKKANALVNLAVIQRILSSSMMQMAILSIPPSNPRRKENKSCSDSSKDTIETHFGKKLRDKKCNLPTRKRIIICLNIIVPMILRCVR